MRVYVVHGWKYGPTCEDKWLPDTLFERKRDALKFAQSHPPRNPGEYTTVERWNFPASALETADGWRDGECETVYFKSYK